MGTAATAQLEHGADQLVKGEIGLFVYPRHDQQRASAGNQADAAPGMAFQPPGDFQFQQSHLHRACALATLSHQLVHRHGCGGEQVFDIGGIGRLGIVIDVRMVETGHGFAESGTRIVVKA